MAKMTIIRKRRIRRIKVKTNDTYCSILLFCIQSYIKIIRYTSTAHTDSSSISIYLSQEF